MKHSRSNSFEKGQSLLLVALLMLVFLGLLAIAMDGGNAYAMRRAAQTAADAGALAGAREICIDPPGDPYSRAWEYSVGRNHATNADVTIDNGEVTVVAQITFRTFFAAILGRPQVTASAVATAGCFSPSGGTGVLPIAWSCRLPVGASDSDDCTIKYGDDQIYIIMDSEKTGPDPDQDFYCQDPLTHLPAGALDCDYNDDGINDILAGGDRSWLDLNGGGGGASEMSDWILNGFPDEVHIHTWMGGQSGVAESVFQTANSQVGKDVVIPVFDQYCDQPGSLPETSCPALYHSGDPQDVTVPSGGTSTLYYHIISFSVFHITCVDAPPYGPCPAHKDAGIKGNVKTIEGYFVQGPVPGLTGRPGDGIDAGAYSLYLTR
jgi:Putative Flp pilus-assembly TadE/G-like